MSSIDPRHTCPVSGGPCKSDCTLYNGYQHAKCGLSRIETQIADVCVRIDAILTTLRDIREVTR